MASKNPTPGTAMTKGEKMQEGRKIKAGIKSASNKPNPTVKTKVQDKVKEVKGAYDKISKMGPPVKGGPRPKMERMVQPAKTKGKGPRGR